LTTKNVAVYLPSFSYFAAVPDKPENRQNGFRQIALATTIPLIMLAAPAVGYFIGTYLDKVLGTSGIMMLIFLLLGLAAGGLETVKLIKEINKEN
jgi:F0F1-type ATP synthase assembly protein I